MVGPHSAAEVRSRLKNVLERCEEKQITTVSFPAVGTGTDLWWYWMRHVLVIMCGCVSLRLTALVKGGGGVKGEDAICAMLQGFEDHLARNVSTVIKLIYIVINQDNGLQEFQKGLKTWIANTQVENLNPVLNRVDHSELKDTWKYFWYQMWMLLHFNI